MRTFSILCFAAVCACGGSQGQSTAPVAHELGVPSASKFASREQCEQAVKNLEKSEQESTTTPVGRKGLFNRTAFNERHRDRVRNCETTLSEKEAKCIAEAASLQYVRECRKFALVR
jgi:hypothetical protein